MPIRSDSPSLRYVLAAAAVLLATVARLALDPLLGESFPFATLFLAILIVAGLGGRGPALLATGLGALASARFLLPPREDLAVRGFENQAGLVLYLAVGAGIALLGGAMRTARRRAETSAEVALGQREQLRITLSSIGDAVLVTDAAGKVTSLNSVAEALTGWSAPEAAGRPLEDVFRIVNEGMGQPVENPVARVLREGTVAGLANHTILIARDGTERPIDDSAAPLRGGDGGIIGVVLVFRDVAQKRQAERELRRRAEELAIANSHLEAVFESVNEGIVVFDPQGHVVYCNAAEARICGYATVEEMLRDLAYFAEVFELADSDGHLIPLDQWPVSRVLRGEAVADWEVHGRRKDTGQEWEFSFSGNPVRDADGRQVLAVLVTRDITQRKRSEEALRRSEDRFRTLIDSIPQLAWTARPDGHIFWYNRRWYEYTGTALEQMEGWGWQSVHDPQELPEVLGRWRASIATGEPFDMVFPLRGSDGRFRPFLTRVLPVKDERGHVLQWIGTNTDVTERAEAEAALRASEARFRQLADTMPQIVWTATQDGSVDYFNARWYEFTGMAPEASLSDGWRAAVHPDDLPRLAVLRDRAVGEGEVFNAEVRLRHREGPYRYHLIRSVPVRDEAGRVAQRSGTATDIDDRKRAGEALTISEERLRLALEAGRMGVWDWDVRTGALAWSDNLEPIHGLAPGTFGGTFEAFQQLIHPEDRDSVLRAISRSLEAQSGFDVEFRTARPDGDVHWMAGKGKVFSEEGRPARLIGVGMDITGRRQAEDQVRFQAHLLDAVGQAAIVTDPEGRVIYWNRFAETLYGWTRAEATGRPILELVVAPEEVGRAAEIMGRMHAGESWSGEITVRRRNGESFPAFVTDTPVFDDRGGLRAIIGVSTDITERKRAEEALRASEERLRLILESATDYAIFTLDLDGKVATWNSGARNLLGYEEAEIVGRDGKVLFIPEDIERGVPGQEIQKALERGRAENERWHVRQDGSRFWASGLLMPLRDGDRAIGLLKIMRDTTEQKRIEQELEVSRERLDLVVNSSEVGLWYCDLPFDKLLWNAKCKEHFGLPPNAEVTIDTFYQRLHPEDRERTRRAIERAIEGRTDYDVEYRTVAPGGRVRWVRAIGRAFYDPAGTPLRFDGITVDVTHRIQQEEALREADRRKDEFLATLAHELRNPLAPIRNALHLMGQPAGDGQGHGEERAMAERQVALLARLVDDLMDVARISTGKIELRREVVDLDTIVRRAVESARTAIDERDHDLVVASPGGSIRLEADPVRLEQVLWNLLNNAAKYSEPGGRIDLTVERDDGEVVLRVRDTGIGIDPAMLPRVFTMFTQVDHRSARTQGGLGIGLGLVKSLVEMHGGTITAHSEGPGTGSEFVVRLPILPGAQEDGEGPAPASRTSPPGRPPRRRILVVDDNVDAAASLAKVLTRLMGQEVRVAHDGLEALEAADEFRPEIVLLDIGMPGLDGYEVAERLRREPEFEGTLLVALTGWGQPEDQRRSQEVGFDRHLVKPVDPEALRELLAGTPAEDPSGSRG
jgi:PAS domain S-box-containing protein